MISVGAIVYETGLYFKIKWNTIIILLVLTSTISFFEIKRILSFFDESFYIDITITNMIPAFLIFVGCIKIGDLGIKTYTLRKISDIIYIIHPIVLFVYTKAMRKTHLERFISCIIISIILAIFINKIMIIWSKKMK